MNCNDLVATYRQSGFREIGGGFYSKVYAKDGTDWCIKVGRQLDGYLAFVQLAVQEGWIGSHAPYIYSIKVVDGFYITIMERLAVCYGDSSGEICDFGRALKETDEWDHRLDRIANHIEYHRSNGADLRMDAHRWNWMLRRDGTMVLIDPIAGDTKQPIMTGWRNPKPRPVITDHPLLAAV